MASTACYNRVERLLVCDITMITRQPIDEANQRPVMSDDMNSETLRNAAILWEFLSQRRRCQPSDAIVVCCSYDLRVADYAAELYHAAIAPVMVISGKSGNWTKHLWSHPEAQIFRDQALAAGVPSSAILLEEEATNFGENIRFSRLLLPEARRVLFLTKPNSVLRVLLTAAVQWPDVDAAVDAPRVSFPDDVSNVVGILGLIEEMVGDVDRIDRYPALGYQAPCEIPPAVRTAWHELKAAGFTGHLMPS